MVLQVRGKVFWKSMHQDLRKLAREFGPCAEHHISNSQRDVEVSHTPSLTPIRVGISILILPAYKEVIS